MVFKHYKSQSKCLELKSIRINTFYKGFCSGVEYRTMALFQKIKGGGTLVGCYNIYPDPQHYHAYG